MTLRLGITMMVNQHTEYPDRRDALSHDWQLYIKNVFPDILLVPLINDPEYIIPWVEELKLDGIVLSNGNNWGSATERDETEQRLVEYGLSINLPILGVCRGLQVLNVLFGGKLVKDVTVSSGERHVATEHPVQIIEKSFKELSGKNGEIKVNSYHNQGVLLNGLADELVPFAITLNNVVEGFTHPEKPVLALQWHPERSSPSSIFDREIITRFFLKRSF